MTDILVTLVDLIHQFLDRDVVLVRIRQTLVERPLQGGISLLLLGQLLLEGGNASIGSCQLFLHHLIVRIQFLVLVLQVLVIQSAVLQIFLTGAAAGKEHHSSSCHPNNTFFHLLFPFFY